MVSTFRRLVAVSGLACALLVAEEAPAAVQVHKLTGTFHAEGVPGTGTVSLKVVVKKGSPTRVKDLRFKNLPARCNVSETPGSPIYEPAGTMSGGGGRNSNGDGIEFGRAVVWISYPGNGARQVLMNGKLNRSGRRLRKGKLEVHNNAPGACQSAVGTFIAK